MTKTDAEHMLHRLFTALINPAVSLKDLKGFFTPDYMQLVDGKSLDLNGFIDHVATLRRTLATLDVEFENIIANDTTLADIHTVTAHKKAGGMIKVKVIAFYTLHNGKISRIEELTRLITGNAADGDIGSRIDRKITANS